jgi:mRNA interferase MazF
VVARGEVWWYEDPRAGRRPYLVLIRDAATPVLNQVLAAPATRTIRGIPTEVVLDETDGMPTECTLTLDNVTVIRPALCTDRTPVSALPGCVRSATPCGSPPAADVAPEVEQRSPASADFRHGRPSWGRQPRRRLRRHTCTV